MAGERPGVLLGSDRVLLHYATGPISKPSPTLVCLDFGGRELWSRPGLSGHLALPNDRLQVNTAEAEPLLIDGSGTVVRRWGGGGVDEVTLHGGLLVFVGGQQVSGADLELNPLWRLSWPAESRPEVGCLVDGCFYWAAGDELRFWAPGGTAGTQSRLPDDLISATREQYERETGGSWPSGVNLPYWWRVSFDRGRGGFFLANASGPHLVLCLDRLGQPLWCTCLSPACCGGIPSPLPDGRYVASSGCGGVLSWLDGDGNVLFQSRPQGGVGLAAAYTDAVRVLPGGRVLADGGPGLVAFSSAGERLWVFGSGFSQFDCDPTTGVLVGCYWQNNEPNGPNRATVEFATGL